MKLLSLALAAASVRFAWSQSSAAPPTPEHTEAQPEGQNAPPLLELTALNWDEEIRQSRWLLVMSRSPYSPHCRKYMPTFQAVYESYYRTNGANSTTSEDALDLRFAELNCFSYFDLCASYGINAYPTTILFEGGKEVARTRGAIPESQLRDFLEEALRRAKHEPEDEHVSEPEEFIKPIEEPAGEPIEELSPLNGTGGTVEHNITVTGCCLHTFNTIIANPRLFIGVLMVVIFTGASWLMKRPRESEADIADQARLEKGALKQGEIEKGFN